MAKQNIRVITPNEIGDFITLYRVFELPPYEEAYTDEFLVEEYNSLSTLGCVFGYYIGEKCVGLITYYRSANKNGIVNQEHPVNFEHPENVVYFSDVTVLPKYRGHGIGTQMVEYMIEDCQNKNIDKIYMRTLPIGQSMSYNIAVKHGFKLMENVTQSIIQERVNEERNMEDVRIFLEKDLI